MTDLDNTVKALVTEAIFKAIDEKKREEMMKAAIASLLKKPENQASWRGEQNTPLQDAFDTCVRQVAMEICREKLTKDEGFRKMVESVVVDAMQKVWATDKREKLIDNIAEAVVEGMKIKERF